VPELPEVETIKRDLEKFILGKKITEVYIHNPKVLREISPSGFKKGLLGTTFKNILRRAKVLILELSNGKSLVIHLKMTGQLVYPGGGKLARVGFKLSNGQILDFNDQRLFAELRLLDDWRKLKFIQGLGPEPLDLSFEDFRGRLKVKKTKIKPLLMEQSFISGIGNIYASECLFRAKINPERSAQSLKDFEIKTLLNQIKEVLKDAIKHGGSSVDDYVRLSGEKGNYSKLHQVYGREGKPCFVCEKPVKKTSLGGRGTYFCLGCQR
jgi:formamidopyrimidine-DNA glycosylase